MLSLQSIRHQFHHLPLQECDEGFLSKFHFPFTGEFYDWFSWFRDPTSVHTD